MNKYICIALFILICPTAHATVYYVAQGSGCSDSGPGTEADPWCTIQHAADVAQAGDIVLVKEGTYEERISFANSGNSGSYINFAGQPGYAKPVVRGFDVHERSYIRIIGFEVTHNTTSYNHGIVIALQSHHIEVLDNYIHHVQGHAIRWYNQDNSYITVRGNEMYMAGCPNVAGSCSGNGWAVQMAGGNHLLVEYNHSHRVGDFVNIHATYSIIRNNYLHDFQNSYWPEGPGDALHADMFQPAGSPTMPSQYQIYESNFMGDNIELNSHILQMRTEDSEDHHIAFRGNVGYNHGSYAMQCGGVDNVYYYSNTIHNINNQQAWAAPAVGYNGEPPSTPSDISINNYNFNNIYSDTGPLQGPPISVDSRCPGCSVEASNNLCYQTGSHASCESTGDPMFVASASYDFHLQPGSPAIGLGKATTVVTSSSGSGTSFEVEQADFFTDGYGVVEGDIIKMGNNNPVRITDITSNTITVDRSITWNTSDGVYWRNQDTSPDIGAYEYSAGGYQYDIAISNPADHGIVSGSVTITATSVNEEYIRYVFFYIDGIPVAQDFESPYSYIWDASGESDGSIHTVEARAYPLHASSTLWETAQITVYVGNAPLRGDVNNDGDVNNEDVECCANHILGRDNWGSRADVDEDGRVDVLDVQEIINIILNE